MTKEELEALTSDELTNLAESYGVEVVTKGRTINRILKAQDAQTTSATLLKVSNEPATEETAETAKPTSKRSTKAPKDPVPSQPRSFYEKLGYPVGSDGQKKRYRLDGTPIN